MKYLEVRDCSFKKVGGWLKIGIENSHELIVFDIATIHSRLEITRFIAISNHTMPIQNVGTRLLPFINLLFNQQSRRWIIRIIENLY